MPRGSWPSATCAPTIWPAWPGRATGAHLRSVAAALRRAAQGLEDYLVVRAPGGQPVAKMRADYSSEADTGVFSQLAT